MLIHVFNVHVSLIVQIKHKYTSEDMHLWKLLATFAIRYHILNNSNNSGSPTEEPSGNSDRQLPPIHRTKTSKSQLARLWLQEERDLLEAHSILPNTSTISTQSTTTSTSTTATTTGTTTTPVRAILTHRHHGGVQHSNPLLNSGVQPDFSRLQLPWDISFIKVQRTRSQVGVLPKLAWLALTTSVVSTLGHQTCARWNCPCAGGYPSRVTRSVGGINVPLLRGKTAEATSGVMDLLHKIETRRFRNANHVQALQRCSHSHDASCIAQYLEKNCTINGLPTLQHIQDKATISQFDDFLHESRKLLASIAMFMDVARREEQHHTSDRAASLTDDIRLLEETGVYHLLCSMDKMLTNHEVETLPKEVVCDATLSRSKSDNRSYIVLHTFKQLLQSIMDKMDEVYN